MRIVTMQVLPGPVIAGARKSIGNMLISFNIAPNGLDQ